MRGWKLEEVAFHSGLASKGHLSDIEHGRVVPTVGTLSTLAAHFGVELCDLMVFPERGGRHALVDATRALGASEVERWLAEARAAAVQRSAPAANPLQGARAKPRRPAGPAVPLVDLDLAPSLAPAYLARARAWVAVDAASATLPGAFAARVRASAMEPRVPRGALCLFRRPGPGNRTGRVFLVDVGSPERGEVARRTLAMLAITLEQGERRVSLRQLNEGEAPLVAAREKPRVVAELVRVLPVGE
jgi:transcriptional regulator with XRE-family HTH domain